MAYCGDCGAPIEVGERCIKCSGTTVKSISGNRPVASRRFAAALLDTLIVVTVMGALLAVFAMTKRPFVIPGFRRLFGILLPIVLAVGYVLMRDAFGGKSIGKMLCNITAVNRWGQPTGFVDSVLRNWLLAIPPFALIVGLQLSVGRPSRLGEPQGFQVVHDDDLLERE